MTEKGKECDKECEQCERCIAEEEAWQKIDCYINCHGYDWTYNHIRHDYQKYYMSGGYCSHTLMDIIKHNEEECRLLFGTSDI